MLKFLYNNSHYCTGGNSLWIVTRGKIDTLTCMSFDFLQRRRKLNNSETTGQLPWIHRDDFNIINGTRTNFSVRRLPLSKLTRFFSLQPLLNRILEVRSRYISRCDTGDSIDQTLPFVSQLFVFLPSFFLLFLYFFFFLRTHPLVDKCVLKGNIVTTIYFERHTYINLGQLRSLNETEIVIMILYRNIYKNINF